MAARSTYGTIRSTWAKLWSITSLDWWGSRIVSSCGRMGEDAFVEDERNRRALRKDIKSLISAVHRQVPLADPTERLERRRAVTPARIEPDRAIAGRAGASGD